VFIQNRIGLVESVESMLNQERRMEQTTNNLANVNTAGYKKENTAFHEMLFIAENGQPRVGKAIRITTDHTQGATETTGNPLDLAITGDGYFKIQTPNGIRYTRAGEFTRNNQYQLTTPGGDQVLGQGGPIVINGKDVQFQPNGDVVVDGQVTNRLDIVTFNNKALLEKEGRNLLRLTGNGAEVAAEQAAVRQGVVEKSNVNTVQEMTEMISLQRDYEAQQKLIRTIDEIDGQTVRRVGSLTQ